jgi:hypothetical protein
VASGSNVTQQQLAIAQSMLAVTQQMAAAIDDVNKKQQDQVKIMSQIHDTMKLMDTRGLVTALEQVVKSVTDLSAKFDKLGKTSQQAISNMTRSAGDAAGAVKTLNGSVNDAGRAAGTTTANLTNMTKAVKDNEKATKGLVNQWNEFIEEKMKQFPKTAIAVVGALEGMSSAFSGLGAMIKVGVGMLETAVNAILEIGKAIISIPFTFLDVLVEKSNALASGSGEWHAALQAVKKEYGDLQQVSTKSLVSMAKAKGSLAGTGVNEWRVFGTRAEFLQDFLEVSKGMGALWDNFAAEFEATEKIMPALLKGLGLTGEEARSVGMYAKTMGQDMGSVLLSIHKQSFNLGKQFGVSTKLISRDISKAMADVKHFGGATIKQIGVASVYARRLGLELDKIVGVLDAFETFEGAAENASKLSQAFGVQIDAFGMMESQDPAGPIEALRKSFAAAGKDAATFNRQELSLLATTTGLAPEVAKQAFSLKNQGVSLDKLTQQSENADKAMIDLKSAVKELKGAIDEKTKGGSRSGGFLQQFIESIGIGFERTSEFRGLMYNMIKSMTVVRQEGRRLGRAIMESFPGIKTFFEGLSEFFRPGKFRTLFGGVVTEVIKYMKALSAGTMSFRDVASGIGKVWEKFTGQQGGAMGKIVEGFKTIFKTVSFIVSEAIRWITDKVKDGIIYIVDIISGKKRLTDSGAGSFISNALEPLGEALVYAWKELTPKIMDLLGALGSKIWGWIDGTLIPMFWDAAPMIAGALFGVAFFNGLLSVASAGIAKKIGEVLFGKSGDALKSVAAEAGKNAGESAAGAATSAGQDKLNSINDQIAKAQADKEKNERNLSRLSKEKSSSARNEAKNVRQKIAADSAKIEMLQADKAKLSDSLGQTAKMQEGVNKVAEQDKKSKGFGAREAGKLALKLAAIAVVIVVGGIALAHAIAEMAEVLKETDFKDLMKTLLVLGAMIGGIVVLSGAMVLLDKVSPKAFIGLAVLAVALGILLAATWGLIKITDGVDPKQLDAAGKMMVAMGSVFLTMIPVVLGAMGLGVAIAASKLLGIGAAALGLGAIGTAVVEVGATVKKLLIDLAGLQLPDDIDKRVDAFVKVMDSIVLAIKEIGGILSILEDLDEDDFATNMNSVTKFTETLIGKPGEGGLIGLVETVMKAIKEINVGDLGSSASTFAEMLAASATLINALKPPDSLIESATSWLPGSDADNIVKTLTAGETYIDKITTSLGTLLETVKQKTVALMKDISGLSTSPEQLSAMGSVMSSIAAFIQAVTPSPELINSFKETTKIDNLIDPDVDNTTFNIGAITEYFTRLETALPPLIDKLTGGVLKPLIDKLSGFSAEQIQHFVKIGEVISSVVELVKAITSVGKTMPEIKVEGGKGLLSLMQVKMVLPDITSVLDGLGPKLEELITKVKSVADSMPTGTSAAEFEKKIGIVKTLFELIKMVPELATSARAVGTTSKEFAGVKFESYDAGAMQMYIRSITTFLDGLVVGEKGGYLPPLISSIQTVDKFLQRQSVGNATVTKVVERVKGFFSGVKDLSESLAGIKDSMASFDAKAINEPIITPATSEELALMSSAAADNMSGGVVPVDQTMIKEHPMVTAIDNLLVIIDAIAPVSQRLAESLVALDRLIGKKKIKPENIQNMTDFFKNVSSLSAELSELEKIPVPNSSVLHTKLLGIIDSITKSGLAGPVGPENKSRIEQLSDVLTGNSGIKWSILNNVDAKMKKLSTIMSNMSASLQGMSSLMGESTLVGSLNKVTQVVEAVNRLNTALGSVNLGTVKAAMTPTTKGMKGNSGTVNVTTTPATFNINLVVDLNAARLEQALIVREESVIRDRLNLMMGDGAPANAASKVPVEGVPKPKGELAEGNRVATFAN